MEHKLLFSLLTWLKLPNLNMSIFKYTGNLKEIYREHPYTYHLDSTINILLYLLYHTLIHPSIPTSIH